jgi:hypothetical protein
MFLPNSRYAAVPAVTTTTRDGREVTALKLRVLPATSGGPHEVKDNDQLDMMAQAKYADGTRHWHIADANTELKANDLLKPVGRVISVPET